MALINYVEPIQLFSDFGTLLILGVVAYLLFKGGMPIVRLLHTAYTHLSKRMIVEDAMLELIAKERGVDIQKLLLENERMYDNKKNLGKKIDDEIYSKLFGDQRDKK